MNILIFSDTHKNIKPALELYERIAAGVSIDLLIHCGDVLPDAAKLENKLHLPMIAVPGNNDGCISRDFRTVDTPAGRLLVTHGHTEGVNYGLDRLYLLAKQENCRIACFGHTHVALIEEEAGIRFINPGSTSRPRDGSSGSCALLVATETALSASILYL